MKLIVFCLMVCLQYKCDIHHSSSLNQTYYDMASIFWQYFILCLTTAGRSKAQTIEMQRRNHTQVTLSHLYLQPNVPKSDWKNVPCSTSSNRQVTRELNDADIMQSGKTVFQLKIWEWNIKGLQSYAVTRTSYFSMPSMSLQLNSNVLVVSPVGLGVVASPL